MNLNFLWRPLTFTTHWLILLLLLLAGCDRPPPPQSTGSTPAHSAADLPATTKSFETAKNWLYEKVYYDHPKTFYCGCDYTRSPGQAGAIDARGCGLQARQDPERARRLEAEHAFPAAQFGNFRPCWRSPKDFPACVQSDGKTRDLTSSRTESVHKGVT